jgi:hypothetical protein
MKTVARNAADGTTSATMVAGAGVFITHGRGKAWQGTE